MKFSNFKEALSDYIVFSVQELKKLDPHFYPSRLIEWQKRGIITKIRRGFYCFKPISLNDEARYRIANQLYKPSYVSFETALAYYQLIPESLYAVTSASNLKTQTFQTSLGTFLYYHLKPSLIFGYEIVAYANTFFKIAVPEKAILDFLYLRSDYKNDTDFESLRFDLKNLLQLMNIEKIKWYTKQFENQQLAKRVYSFLRYLRYAQPKTD